MAQSKHQMQRAPSPRRSRRSTSGPSLFLRYGGHSDGGERLKPKIHTFQIARARAGGNFSARRSGRAPRQTESRFSWRTSHKRYSTSGASRPPRYCSGFLESSPQCDYDHTTVRAIGSKVETVSREIQITSGKLGRGSKPILVSINLLLEHGRARCSWKQPL